MSLSQDLRKRMLGAYENNEGSLQEVAKRFKVNASTLWRLLKRKRNTGKITPETSSGRPSKFDRKGLIYLKKCLEKNNTLTLSALAKRYERKRGISVSLMAVHRACKRLNLNYKKKHFIQPSKKNQRFKKNESNLKKNSKR